MELLSITSCLHLLLLIYCAASTASQSLQVTWNSTVISRDPNIPDPRVLIYHDEINMRNGGEVVPDGGGVLVCRHSGDPGDVEWLQPGSSTSIQSNNINDFRIIRQTFNGGPTRLQLARVVQTPETAGNEGLWSCNGGGLSRRYVSLYKRGNGGIMNVVISLHSSSFGASTFVLAADTTGGPPTTFSWTRNNITLNTGISIEADPNNRQNDRMNCRYRSTLQVTSMLPGVYEYHASNRATSGNVRGSFTIEGGDPSNLQVVQTGINMVELTWDPPPGPPARGYQVQYTRHNRTSANTSLTLDALPPGEYSFQVISISRHFPNGTVGPVIITIKGAFRPAITLSELTATSVSVSWFSPPMFSFTVTTYDVAVRRLTDCSSVTGIRGPRTQNANDLTELFEGLGEYINYRAEVRAFFQSPPSFTVSPVTAETEFTTLAIAPSEVPSNVVPVTTSRTITVSWDAIDCSNENGPNFRYDVEFQQMDGRAAPVGTVNNVRFTVEGLQIFTKYTFRVRGVNSVGNGDYTSFMLIQTNEEAPSEIPINVASMVTSRTIHVSWDAIDPNGPNLRYEVDFQQIDEGAVPDGMVNEATFTVEGLQPFTNYTFRVRGVNDVGSGNYTDPIMIQTKQDLPSEAPTNVAFNVTSRTVSASWDPINQNGPNLRYQWEILRVDLSAVAANSTLTSEGLQPFTNYTLRVRGVNEVGNGHYSDLIMIQTDQDMPGSVADFAVKLSNLNSALVTWSPPQEPNGIIIVYELTYLLNETISVSENITNRLNFTIHSEVNTRIEVRVRAYTSAGPGPNVTASIVFSLPIVTNVQVRSLTKTSVIVTWDRITDIPEIAQYMVYYASAGTNERSITVPSTENSVEISGLKDTVEYQYQVTAVAMFDERQVEGERSPVTGSTKLRVIERGDGDVTVAVSVSVVVSVLLTIILYSAVLLAGYYIVRAHRKKHSKNINVPGSADGTSGMPMKENSVYDIVASSQEPHDYIYAQPDVKTESQYVNIVH